MVCLEEVFLVTCAFSKKKVHSLSVAPEPLAIWKKSWRVLNLSCSEELYTFPIAAPENISGLFCSGRTRMQGLGVFFDSLLLSDVVVWWWLSVNAFCSWVVLCWYILPNMLVIEYCYFTLESSFIEFCLFTVSFVRLVSLVLLVHVHRSFGL